LISFQIDLVPLQYHIGKVSKSSRLAVAISARSYAIVMGLLFIFGILAQVGACPKEMGSTPSNPLNILPLGHLLRRPARASKSSWRLNPCQVRVHPGLQEQFVVKPTFRLHTESKFDVLHLYGKLRR
jgi:hypothetical protein